MKKKVCAERMVFGGSDEAEILESIPDAFYAVDSQWRFIYVNKEYEYLQNRRKEDLLGKNVWELFPYGKKLRFYREYERVMREQVSAHFEEYNPDNGMWVQVNAYPTHSGGIAIYFTDITKSKQTEEQIFRDEQNLRAIINNTPDIIWSMDRNQAIISANHAFWERIALITGKQTFEVTEKDYDPQLFVTWQSYFDRALAGEAYKIIWTDKKDNTTIYEEVSFNPIYGQDGNVSGISCFSRDVTEQKKHQQKIESQNAQLREIAWIYSHRVRNHVANIMGIIQLIDSAKIADPQTVKMIHCLQQSTHALDKVVKEISDRAQVS